MSISNSLIQHTGPNNPREAQIDSMLPSFALYTERYLTALYQVLWGSVKEAGEPFAPV
jgi:hypothetical protein